MSALPKRHFTQEEYALLEDQADYKSQYVEGEIFSMAGAAPAHVQLESNIGGMLYVAFRGRDCKHFTSNMRVRVKAGELWTYPDAIAVCGKPNFDTKNNPASLLNPQVIIEILSPSTASFDRGDKFARYQKLESLTDYVLVASNQMEVVHYTRKGDGTWNFRRYVESSDVLPLATVEVDMTLTDIYEKVDFLQADDS